jgi:hypothetical protein
MASTFSPNLRIELIGAGEQSGAWNNTTNTNLGTLIEQAITGVLDLTMIAADYTLEAANGADDEARNMVLILGGSPGASRSIIAPDVDKIYIVRNTTAYSHTIKTSSGSGVSIPANSSALVFCDATGSGTFYNAIEDLAAGATINGAEIVTVSGAQTIADKTLTAPKFADGGFIADANGNELIIMDTVTSAVNEVTVANAATSSGPSISSTGSDTNIDLNLLPKGTGAVNVTGVVNVSGRQVISVTDNTNAALRVTQLGTGNAILVEDSSNPDSTPFVVNASGSVGIGITSPSSPLDISGTSTGLTISNVRNLDTTLNSGSQVVVRSNNNTEAVSLTSYAQAGGYLLFNNATGGVITTSNAQPVQIWTNSLERFRVGPVGQLGVAGANYGTAGQVLTSGGASAAPSWASNTPAALSTASGSAPSYSARAWVSFNGTGTVAILASGNVTSITDRGQGAYTVNLTTAMQDTNYAVVGTTDNSGTSGFCVLFVNTDLGTRSTTVIPIDTRTNGNDAADTTFNSVTIFR